MSHKMRSLKLLVAVIVCLMMTSVLWAAENKLPRIAVVEFSINNHANTTLAHDAISVRNQVQSYIVRTGNYDVIAREEIDKLLENQKIQYSEISSSENIKKLRLQNISYLVTGTVDAVGYDYVVCISMLDVSTGKFTYSDDQLMGTSSTALYDGTKTLVGRFLKNLSVGNENGTSAVSRSIKPDFVFVEGNSKVSSFYICDHEVTQAEYRAVTGENPSCFKGDNKPVECVTWYDAVEYCNKLSQGEGLTPCYNIDKSRKDPNNTCFRDDIKWTVTWNRFANGYRLPTESEWEYAARGGKNTIGYIYSGSDNINSVAYYCENADKGLDKNNPNRGTHSVKYKAHNELSLYDMSGNVFEWCWDWYEDEKPMNPEKDFVGPMSGLSRVNRGGCWYTSADTCKPSHRGRDTPDYREGGIGFRVVRNAK